MKGIINQIANSKKSSCNDGGPIRWGQSRRRRLLTGPEHARTTMARHCLSRIREEIDNSAVANVNVSYRRILVTEGIRRQRFELAI
jgi:hypothetical protein